MPSPMFPPRPVTIFVASAAAAFAVFLIYRNAGKPHKPDLHRSRSVRRTQRDNSPQAIANRRHQILPLLGPTTIPLGVVGGFGPDVDLDVAHVFSPTQLRMIASVHRRNASIMEVERAISNYYDALVTKLKARFQGPSLTPQMREFIISSLSSSIRDSETARLIQHASKQHFPALTETIDLPRAGPEELGDRLLTALYELSKKRTWDSVLHRSTKCASCSHSPIRGIRWHCANCPVCI